MAKTSKAPVSDETKQTRLLIVAGVVLALLVFMFFTKGQLASRDAAQSDMQVQKSAREAARAELAAYQQNPQAANDLLDQLTAAEAAIPYYGSANPTGDLLLSVPGTLADALDSVGIKFSSLPVPQVANFPQGTPRNTGAISIALRATASSAQIGLLLDELDTAGMLATVGAISYRPAQQEEGDDAVFEPSGFLDTELTLLFWFSTVPPYGTESTTPGDTTQTSSSIASDASAVTAP